jgi:hypothetical protein
MLAIKKPAFARGAAAGKSATKVFKNGFPRTGFQKRAYKKQ